MIPNRIRTSVCVSPAPSSLLKRDEVCMDLTTAKRYKEGLEFGAKFVPVLYRGSMICYNGCGRRRYLSSVRCEPRVTPTSYHESIVVYPESRSTTFISSVDYRIDACRRWFKTTVEFKAKTYTTTKIQSTPTANKPVNRNRTM